MEKNNTQNVYNLIILDESGSMHIIYDEALTAINETINGIRNTQKDYPDQHQFVSIITFEGYGVGGVKTRRDRVDVDKVTDFTHKDYRPGGCTPLYDAMGKAISELDGCICEGDAVMVTVITDGEENSSGEYSGKAVKDLVSRQKKKGWTFAYIGANQDAVEVAKGLNIPNALNFDASPEGMAFMSMKYEKARKRFVDKVMFCLSDKSTPCSFDSLFDEEEV